MGLGDSPIFAPSSCVLCREFVELSKQFQSLGRFFGIRLPVMMGVTFAAVGPMVAMANAHGGVDGVYTAWGTPAQAKLGSVTVEEVVEMKLPAGSRGPKVAAACEFASATKNEAVIGSLADIDAIVTGSAGTRVRVG